jgi:CRISPR-associated endonuclease/helicase Cas3
VEASLDLDFDILHTEICTIDSLLQRFGRVWRNREYSSQRPNIYIYDNVSVGSVENYTTMVYNEKLLIFTKEHLNEYSEKLLSEECKHKMFNEIFKELNERCSYIKCYNNMNNLLDNGYEADKRSKAQDELRKSGMLTYNLIPENYRVEAKNLFEQLESENDKKEQLKLQAKITNLSVPAAVKKDMKNFIDPLSRCYPKSFFAKTFYFAGVGFDYDDELGLRCKGTILLTD